MLQIDSIPCRECGTITCHIPVEPDNPLYKFDGLCPRCAMVEAAKGGDTALLDALVEVASQAVKLTLEIIGDDEECTPEHVYQQIMEFLRRYPDLRKRLQYELNNSEIVTVPMQRNDPRFG